MKRSPQPLPPRRRGASCAAVVAAVFAGPLAGATQVSQESAPRFTSEVAQVVLQVAVFDDDGLPVTDLQPGDFEIVEVGTAQPAQFVFRGAAAPVDVAIVLDLSGSMSERIDDANRAVREFSASLQPSDCLLFLPFAQQVARPRWIPAGGEVPPVTREMIGRRDMTALNDAVVTAQAALRARQVDTASRRAGLTVQSSCGTEGDAVGSRRQLLVVVSDGLDGASRAGWAAVMDNMLESRVPVVSIYAGADLRADFSPYADVSWREFCRARLQALAEGSSGIFESLDNASYTRLFDRLVAILRASYVVTFTRSRDSLASAEPWRAIEVRVRRDVGDILAPEGYYTRAQATDAARTDLGLARALEEAGDLPAAIETLERALTRAPESARLRAELARALELESEFERALEAILASTRARPGTGHAHAAQLASRVGQHDLAIDQAVRAYHAGEEIGGLLAYLRATAPSSAREDMEARLAAPTVFLTATTTNTVRHYLHVRELDAALARIVSDLPELGLATSLSEADFLVWFDVQEARASQPRVRGRLRLNLPRHLEMRPPMTLGIRRDSPFTRLRPRTLESRRAELSASTDSEEVGRLAAELADEIARWIAERS